MIQVRDNRGNYHEALAIYDNAGREIKEVRNNQGRLLFKNWNEIQGSPPITFRGYGKNLTECRIYGNTVQNGNPSPEAPVDVVGCGVRTVNLFSGEFSQFNNVGGTGDIYAYFYIPEDFTLTLIAKDTHTIPSNVYLGITKDGGQATGGFTWAILQRVDVTEGDIFTVESSINGYHYVSMYRKDASALNWMLAHYYIMLNLGSTALPYEPYGYKLPLIVNGAEHPSYFGQVETTRRIKKLVLTGEEQWTLYNGNYYSSVTDRYSLQNMPCRCTHTVRGIIIDNGSVRLKVFASQFTAVVSNLEEWKTYLQQQYQNGTPVTVWYVLAEPETAIVNEPIQKIGDYSDELSIADIPTINGINTISADTTVQPSEMYIKGKIKSIT